MAKLYVIATGRVKAGAEAELVEQLKLLQERSRKEPGTESYTVHIADTDPRSFAVYEIYTDDEAFATHEKGEGYQGLLPFIQKSLDGELQVHKLRTLS